MHTHTSNTLFSVRAHTHTHTHVSKFKLSKCLLASAAAELAAQRLDREADKRQYQPLQLSSDSTQARTRAAKNFRKIVKIGETCKSRAFEPLLLLHTC